MIESHEVSSLESAALAGLRRGPLLVSVQGQSMNAASLASTPVNVCEFDARVATVTGKPGSLFTERTLAWASASVLPWGHAEPPWIPAPSVQVLGQAVALSTPQTQRALDVVLRFVADESQRQFVRILSIVVSTYEDTEDSDRGLLVSMSVPLQADEALEFWDRLGRRLSGLSSTLPAQFAYVIENVIAVEVRWEDDQHLRSS